MSYRRVVKVPAVAEWQAVCACLLYAVVACSGAPGIGPQGMHGDQISYAE